MKLTEHQLKKVIKEELDNMLNEQGGWYWPTEEDFQTGRRSESEFTREELAQDRESGAIRPERWHAAGPFRSQEEHEEEDDYQRELYLKHREELRDEEVLKFLKKLRNDPRFNPPPKKQERLPYVHYDE